MNAFAFHHPRAETPLHDLQRLGQSVWIDWLSRDLIAGGGLERLIGEYGISGVTTNPTIQETAIRSSSVYSAQIRGLAAKELNADLILFELAATDVADACVALLPTWRETGGRDGCVSWEVAPALAHQAGATVRAAQALRDRVAHPNLLVKIPATPAGVVAIEACVAAGISVNATLIFSLDRHREVVSAYLRGLVRAARAGRELSSIHSVASFFISRLDTAADAQLAATEKPGAQALRGRIGISSAKLAFRQFQNAFHGNRWDALEAAGARPQRCLWASTSTKDAAFSDVMYVEELVGPDTVTTLAEQTLGAFVDHGHAARTLTDGVDEAADVFRELASVGVEVASLTAACEREGVERFMRSYDGAIEYVRREAIRHTFPYGQSTFPSDDLID